MEQDQIAPDYKYWAEVKRIVDGDTIYVLADLGFDTHRFLKLRLTDINTAEIRGEEREEGLADKAFVENLIHPGDRVLIQSYKDGGFGRWAATVWFFDGFSDSWINLNDYLVEQGIAEKV